MSPVWAPVRRLERRAPLASGTAGPQARPGRVLAWLMIIGAVLGTSLRRPLAGEYGLEDLLWALLFAALAGLLLIPYRIWQRLAEVEGQALLAKIRKDTLIVYPRPGHEQRIPLIGVASLERGQLREGATEVRTVQPAAMGGSYWLELDAEQADEVIAFANAALSRHAWHEL